MQWAWKAKDYRVGTNRVYLSSHRALRSASACSKTPDIGRKLYGLMRLAQFSDIDVQVVVRPDIDGRLLPMIRNMAAYAQASGKINNAVTESILLVIEQAISQRSYLALAPQFVVTAIR
jgi:hypothetical protein